MDTNDFWISRISKDLNEEYDYEKGTYLIERNKFDIYTVADKLFELYKKRLPRALNKNTCHRYFDQFEEKDICRAVIMLDDWDGLSNWDDCEVGSLEDEIDIIDGGFGILPLVG